MTANVGNDRGAFAGAELETALAAAGVGVWAWDTATQRLRWSTETQRLYGLPSASTSISLNEFRAQVHPEDWENVYVKMEQAIATRASDFEVEHRIVLSDASIRWVESRGRVVLGDDGTPHGLIGTVLDITARKQDADRLQRSEERYRLFTELASDYVYIADARQPTLAPLIVAGSFERTTGYHHEEIAQLGGWIELIHPDDRGNVPDIFESVRSGRPFVFEYRIRTKSGEYRWLRDRAQPIVDPATGELLQLVGGVQDITERKSLEEQLGHAHKLEALARLAGSVAHDFNNLLTVMYSAVAMLDPAGPPKRREDAVSDLNQAISRAADLTSSLLAFARKRPSVPRVSLLRDVLNNAAPMLQRAIGERVRLVLNLESAAVPVSVDASQLDVALLNLAINARDAMPDGGQLTMTGHAIDLSAADRRRPAELSPARYAVIDVADTGTGIPPEVRARLFEPFFTTKDVGQGTGLGLATVHGIARQAGGAVSVHTELGRGSVFTLHLPIASGPLGAAEQRSPRHSIGGTETLLVVEDEPAVLRMVLGALTDLGYRVLGFSNAEDVLALPADQLADVDLLLTDIRLPVMAGTELAIQLTQQRPTLPVILMSGFIDDPVQQQVVSSGRFLLLTKPFMPEGLARCVREALVPR